jgi:hypothetical protein
VELQFVLLPTQFGGQPAGQLPVVGQLPNGVQILHWPLTKLQQQQQPATVLQTLAVPQSPSV